MNKKNRIEQIMKSNFNSLNIAQELINKLGVSFQ